MAATQPNSIRLFRFAGIDVFLHWSWALIAVIEIQNRRSNYSSLVWNISEYLALFVIVLLHEFGHALACKQVGGKADKIMLWPLGGVAYVSPPQRPGATLWSIAAGPLVNVLLAIPLTVAWFAIHGTDLTSPMRDAYDLLQSVWLMNIFLFIFNMLPVYPLDGGQILRALLWFAVGPTKSLLISSWFGVLGALSIIALALYVGSPWLVVIAIFILLQCRRGIKIAGAVKSLQQAPRHNEFQCPTCKEAPLLGEYWRCAQCKQKFDTFNTGAKCPGCGTDHPLTTCPLCRAAFPFSVWAKPTS